MPARTAHLWTLAAVIVVLDQLTKAWFVYALGSASRTGQSFGQFLPRYLAEFSTGEGSIVFDKYGNFLRDQQVWEPWIRFHLTTNTGAAWSIFAGNSFALSFVSLAIAALLWFVWRRNFRFHPGMTTAIGLIIGGALGNSIDRFRLREVVDFVAVRIPWIGQLFPRLGDPYDFPIFNVADAAAVCGTIALALYLLWLDLTAGKRRRAREAAEQSGFKPFRGGLQLDDEALENLRRLDTKSVPTWNPGMNAIVDEQEEVSRQVVEDTLEANRAAEIPALTADYGPGSAQLQNAAPAGSEAAEGEMKLESTGGAVSAEQLAQLLPDPRVDAPVEPGEDGHARDTSGA
jgi:signal peptidase II